MQKNLWQYSKPFHDKNTQQNRKEINSQQDKEHICKTHSWCHTQQWKTESFPLDEEQYKDDSYETATQSYPK